MVNLNMSMTFKGDMTGNLRTLDVRNMNRVRAVMDYNAPRIEKDMRNNASWTDRTSNARNSLKAESIKGRKNEAGIILSGDVPYMIFLEVRFDGKYAIVKPSVIKWAPKVMEMVSKGLFDK